MKCFSKHRCFTNKKDIIRVNIVLIKNAIHDSGSFKLAQNVGTMLSDILECNFLYVVLLFENSVRSYRRLDIFLVYLSWRQVENLESQLNVSICISKAFPIFSYIHSGPRQHCATFDDF